MQLFCRSRTEHTNFFTEMQLLLFSFPFLFLRFFIFCLLIIIIIICLVRVPHHTNVSQFPRESLHREESNSLRRFGTNFSLFLLAYLVFLVFF